MILFDSLYRNEGPFSARICLQGELNSTYTVSSFCCSSLIFDVGAIAEIKIPCTSKALKLIAEENIGVDQWELVGTQTFDNDTVEACTLIYDQYDLMPTHCPLR